MLKILNTFLCISSIVAVGNCLILPSLIRKKCFKIKTSIHNANQKSNAINVNNNNALMKRNPVNFWPRNGATMSYYGNYIYNKTRRARLNIHMTGFSYVYFLAAIKFNKEIFIDKLLGPENTSENPDWINAQREISKELSEFSLANKRDNDYFYNVFKKWLNSEKGWNSFFDVFTGKNLKNNIYNMPSGYNQAAAEEQFRKQGIILQICFQPPLEQSKNRNWHIIPLPIIFPNIPQIIGLKQYYRTYTKIQEPVWIPPIIPIKIPNPNKLKYKTVQKCMNFIREDLVFDFNLSQQLISDKRVSVDSGQADTKLYWSWNKAQYIKLNFWYNSGKTLYNTQLVNMYLETG